MLTIFPNYAAKSEDNKIWLESGQSLISGALAELNLGVAIAASVHKGNVEGNYSPLTTPGVRFLSLGHVKDGERRWKRGLGYIPLLRGIARAVWRSRFCYIYTPGHVGLLAVLFCWLLRRHYGLYLRGEWQGSTPGVLRFLHERAFSQAALIMCTTDGLTERMRRLNHNCQTEVPVSLLLSENLPAPKPRAQEATVKIIFVGQMLREKGIFELLEATDILRRRGVVASRLVMVGAGADSDRFKAERERRGLENFVACLGLVTDSARLAEAYESSDIFCLPSYTEGFPRVLYEAMRFSLPIVTTNVGEIATVIEDGRNGVFCRPRQAMDLADSLQALIVLPQRRAALGAAGHDTLEPLLTRWKNQTHGHQVAEWLKGSKFWSEETTYRALVR